MEYRLTPRQLAMATGVSESSIKRWCDSGEIATVRTPGGHRRIPLSGAIQFVRASDCQLEKPEVLGLPAATRRGPLKLEQAAEELTDALQAGDEELSRQILFELYLHQRRVSEIGDHVIAPAFNQIGHRWESGSLEIFQERRAFELTRNLLHELRLSQEPPRPDAPIALGGTITGDSYSLAPILVELVLREVGWRACYLGSNLPVETLVSAIRDKQPRLFWLSVSHLQDDASFVAEFHQLQAAAGTRTAIVLGGRALSEEVRREISYAAYCETLQHLETFAATFGSALTPGGASDNS